MQLLAKRYLELHPNESCNATDVSNVLAEINNMNFNIDEDVLKKNLKDFIMQQALFETLSDNAEILTSGNGDY